MGEGSRINRLPSPLPSTMLMTWQAQALGSRSLPESKGQSGAVGEQLRLQTILPIGEQLIERPKGGGHSLPFRSGEYALAQSPVPHAQQGVETLREQSISTLPPRHEGGEGRFVKVQGVNQHVRDVAGEQIQR